MKTCAICGHESDADTCPMCGEASWLAGSAKKRVIDEAAMRSVENEISAHALPLESKGKTEADEKPKKRGRK